MIGERDSADSATRPDGWTDAHEAVAQALYADTWTEPKPEYGDEWHHRFQWWQCVQVARLLSDAGLLPHFDGYRADSSGQ